MNIENKISKDTNVLIVLSDITNESSEFKYLLENFCGTQANDFLEVQDVLQKQIYACGDFSEYKNNTIKFSIIQEFSSNYESLLNDHIQVVSLGEVPVIVHNAGVYFRNFFHTYDDYFNKIVAEHEFQDLTESNKPSNALRKGIYLSDVKKEKEEQFRFHLLRCSSNLSGPTDNFREADRSIINSLNHAASTVFEKPTSLNHVLAQIYQNKKRPDNKERKAKIKAHSDKTKDMDKSGLIAFCTFYDTSNFQQLQLEPSDTDRYDWCYKNKSGLTRLHFKLKKTVDDETLAKEFSVTLYPNSVFLIPLSTNRLYTHEIRPSMLNIDKIPTRMGYVVRCSNLEAVYKDQQTYIEENGTLIKLKEMTKETMSELKNTYYEENVSEQKVTYGKVHFSMNLGDYQKPIY